MSAASKLCRTPVGSPVTKLVALAVALAPDWPVVDDLAAATELPAATVQRALDCLCRTGVVVCDPYAGPTRYGLAEMESLTAGRRPDADDVPGAAAVPPGVGGYRLGGRATAQGVL